MDELLGGICIISAIAAWLLVMYWIVRGVARVFFKTDARQTFALRRCPVCGVELTGGDCTTCGWRPAFGSRTPTAALNSVRSHLARLSEEGVLPAEINSRLLAAVAAEEARLAATSAALASAPSWTTPDESIITAEAMAEAPTTEEPPAHSRVMPFTPAATPIEPEYEVVAEAVEEPTPPREQARPAAITTQDTAAPHPQPTGLASLLAAFMEEKNVRWGELVGGLLIVGGSIALVISFWAEIAARPMLKFGLFNGVAGALFALGFYTARKWKLPTTSRGVLAIATLLVPLNFLSIAAFTRGALASDPLVIMGELFSLALFAVLVYWGGRSIVTPAPLALAAGVIGASIASLLIRRWVTPDVPTEWLYVLAGLPLACHVGAVTALLARLRNLTELDEPTINALLRMLGLTAFAALPPCGLLLVLSGNIPETMQRMAPLVALAGTPTMAVGLILWRRVQNAELAGLRTAGTALAVLGSLIMLSGVALAWPEPGQLIAVAGLNFIVLTAVALAFDLAAGHLLAGAALALAYLVLVHVLRGQLLWHDVAPEATTQALLSAASGNALTLLAVLYGLAAAGWRHIRRPGDAHYYSLVAGIAAVASLALVSLYGFRLEGDPYGATWIYGLYAVGALAACVVPWPSATAGQGSAPRIREAAGYVGAALLALALIQGIVYLPEAPSPWAAPWATTAVLHAVLVCGLATLATTFRSRRTSEVANGNAVHTAARDALVIAAMISSALGVLLVVFGLPTLAPFDSALHVLLLAIVWLLAAMLWRSAGLFDLSQAALFAASTLVVADVASRRSWFTATPTTWLDPRMLQMQGCTWATLCFIFIGLRQMLVRTAPAAAALADAKEPAHASSLTRVGTCLATLRALMIRPNRVLVDHVASGVVLAVLFGIAMYGALPGVQQEMMPQSPVQVQLTNQPGSVINSGADHLVPVAAHFEWYGIPHEPALAVGSWLLLALVAVVLVAGLWEGVTSARLGGLLVAGVTTCLLLAGGWESQIATASSLRWLLAIYFAIVSLAIWSRVALARLGQRLGWRGIAPLNSDTTTGVISLAALLSMAPLLIISLFHAGAVLASDPVVGPDPASLFARIGNAPNYALPMLLVSLVLVGYSLRERSSSFAFAGGVFSNLAATFAWLFTTGVTLSTDDAEFWTQLIQLNSLVMSGYGLVWLAVVWNSARRLGVRHTIHPLLGLQAALAIALNLCVLIPSALTLFAEPASLQAWLPGVAAPLGVTATATALLLALLLAERRAPLVSISLAAVGLWSTATLIALFAAGWDVGDWLAYHTLVVARTFSPIVLLGGARLWYRGTELPFRDRRRQAVTFWSVLTIPFIVLLTFRAYDDDPNSLWWSISPVMAAAAVATLITLWSLRRRYLYLAGALLLLATTLWYVHDQNVWHPADDQLILGFFQFNILSLAAPVVLWLLIELRWIRPRRAREAGQPSLPFHRPATWLAIGAVGLLTALVIAEDFQGSHLGPLTSLGGATLAAVGVAALACLWDSRSREAVFALYLYGLVLFGTYLDALNLEGDVLIWRGAIALGAFNLVTSYLWSRRAGLRILADRLMMPPRATGGTDGLVWLVPVTTLSVTLVLLLVYTIELVSPDRLLRITAAQAAIAQAFALAMLARGERAGALRLASLAVGTLGMIAFGWSWIDPSAAEPILARSVATCVALVATAIIYSVGFNRLPQQAVAWINAAARFVPALIAALALSVVVVLAQEVLYFVDGVAVPLAWPGILAVALSLGALFLACLGAALVSGRDPLSLSERGRMTYVYAAEVVLALVFLHIRVTMPWLFSGRFQQYWPLIVMAIAFLGVGLGEWFARRQQQILAQPLERTGILLPLLPVLGFWFFQSGTNYSVVLLVVGGLYATLAVTRKSFGFGILAALAANGGLWHYLHQLGGVGLLEHPQLWMIPPALCVLAAAYLNRERLTPAQMTSVRYITSMTIYLSSTADIFLNGVANAPWLPLVLAALSLGGIFAGIVMRVRAFLFLGTGFLILSIVTIIYHAAVNLDQTWIWAATIVAVGLGIIVLFAVFEKKRHEVQRLVESLRHWQG